MDYALPNRQNIFKLPKQPFTQLPQPYRLSSATIAALGGRNPPPYPSIITHSYQQSIQKARWYRSSFTLLSLLFLFLTIASYSFKPLLEFPFTYFFSPLFLKWSLSFLSLSCAAFSGWMAWNIDPCSESIALLTKLTADRLTNYRSNLIEKHSSTNLAYEDIEASWFWMRHLHSDSLDTLRQLQWRSSQQQLQIKHNPHISLLQRRQQESYLLRKMEQECDLIIEQFRRQIQIHLEREFWKRNVS